MLLASLAATCLTVGTGVWHQLGDAIPRAARRATEGRAAPPHGATVGDALSGALVPLASECVQLAAVLTHLVVLVPALLALLQQLIYQLYARRVLSARSAPALLRAVGLENWGAQEAEPCVGAEEEPAGVAEQTGLLQDDAARSAAER